MSYLDNDNDLFDYDPDDEIDSPTTSSTSSKQKSVDDFMSSAKSIIDELSQSSDDIIDDNKIKLASSFHLATSVYFSKVEHPTYEKAIGATLDKLTNGNFSLLHIFYRTESLIIQRLHFLDLMEKVVESSSSLNDDDNFTIKELFNILKIDFTDEHIKIFYAPSIAIARFCLNVDRVTYQHLGAKLNMPINENLIDPYYKVNSSELNNPVVNDYSDTVYPLIMKSIATEGVLEKLQEVFNVQAGLSNDIQ